MRARSTTSAPAVDNLAPSKSGLLVLSGYGLSVAVERGHLAVSDGIGSERRSGRLSRATCGLRRLVILGHSGAITLEAIRWLNEIGAALIQVDRDGDILLASAEQGRNLPQLRRAQAMAPWTGAGSALAAQLLTMKLSGQANTVRKISGEAAETIDQLTLALASDGSPERLRGVEAQAAALYWQALADHPLRFARRDDARVPGHWRTIGSRASPLTGSARLAATPAHALLNYLYAILEAETRIACLTVGLDPGLGVLHSDLRSRDSLACDLMEAVRPEVDAWLLKLLDRRTFAATDFFETGTGQCRVLPPLTHELAETSTAWAQAVAPIAESAARMLLESAVPFPAFDVERPIQHRRTTRPPSPLPTPLTQSNRSAGRPTNNGVASGSQRTEPRASRSCRECGTQLPPGNRTLCGDDCHGAFMEAVGMPSFKAAGPARLAELRAEGTNPTATPQAQAKRKATMKARAEARTAWEREHAGAAPTEDVFKREILPKLQRAPISAMMRATGLSVRYCAQIRRGDRVPHPMYWDSLAAFAGRDAGLLR